MKVSVGLAALLVLITVAAYQVLTDKYQIESKLLFLKGEMRGTDTVSWPLAKEIEILKSSGLRSYLASRLFDARHDADGRAVSRADAPRSEILRDGLARFTDRRQFEQWLSESFRAMGVVSNGVAKVQLTLDGRDPEFLKAVMAEYVRQYVKHRNAWAPRENSTVRVAAVNRYAAPRPSRLGAIDDRIQELAMGRRDVELALKQLDSGKGIFKGFVPVSQGTGTTYLQRFQDKIVEMEIKKRTMAARFTSRSREMRAINQEIRGIREGMREALNSHLIFLKRKAEDLRARRSQLAKTCGPVRETRASDRANKPCSGRLNGRDSWYFADDGLYIITDRPNTVQRPVTAKAREAARNLYACLFSPESRGTTAVAKASDKAHDHIALAGCVTINGQYPNRAKDSVPGVNPESKRADLAPDAAMNGHFRMVSTDPSETGLGARKSDSGK